jgi:hypothetical protein
VDVVIGVALIVLLGIVLRHSQRRRRRSSGEKPSSADILAPVKVCTHSIEYVAENVGDLLKPF